MFSGMVFIGIILQLAVVVGIIVFAVKLLNRITEISESQKSIANTQTHLVEILANKQKQ